MQLFDSVRTALAGALTPPPAQVAYSRAVLGGLQAKHVYAGTVPPAEVARRRAANKVARASRRRNRHR